MRRAVAGAAAAIVAAVLALVTMCSPSGSLNSLQVLAAQSTADCNTGGPEVGTLPQSAGDPDAPLDVQVASWNVLRGNPARAVADGIRAIGADVVGLQELAPASRRVKVRQELGSSWGMSSGNNAATIVWRADRLTLRAEGSVKTLGVANVERGIDGTTVGPKSVQWVQLETATGASVIVVDHHVIPSIENGGRPDRDKPARLRAYLVQMNAALAVVAQLQQAAPGVPILWTGDFNVDADSDKRVQDPEWPYTLMARHGFRSSFDVLGYPEEGTHGTRVIDYVWVAGPAPPVAQEILPNYGSDHSPVRVAVSNRPGQAAATVSDTAVSGYSLDPTLLCGDSPAVVGATAGNCPPTGLAAENGLSADALLVIRCGKEQFPQVRTFYGVGQRAGESDHPAGNAVDLMVSDIPGYQARPGDRYGWQVARWMQGNADALGVTYVIFGNRIWSTQRDAEGWRPYNRGSGDTALHYDHIHVSVSGSRGAGLTPDGEDQAELQLEAGQWTMFLPRGGYSVGCSITCYPGHTGQDFPARTGTPVTAPTAGTVVRSVAIDKNDDGRLDSYGNLVVLRPADDPAMELYFAHLDSRTVRTGQKVRAGQKLGAVGSTGNSDGPHVHFETRTGGNPVNPLPVLRSKKVNP